MISKFNKKNSKELLRTPILQQTSFWSEVKENLGMESLAFDFNIHCNRPYDELSGKNFLGDIHVLISRMGNDSSIAYVPYGPEFEPSAEDQGIFLEELSESIRGFLPRNCIMIRYDLFWKSLWADDTDFYTDGIWMGPPDKNFQEIRFNFNTVKWNFRKSGTNNLPSSTVFLDLTKDLQSLKNTLKPKTRYNTELANRRGVYIMETDDIFTWYNLYRETALRNKLYLHSLNYFRTVLTIHSEDAKSPAEVILLFAMYDEQPLAAMFLVITGSRATYLYGASSSRSRNLMAPYALQWHAIKTAKEKGCIDYDMFGVSPQADPSHPLYGLYRFKTGFGGKIYHTLGCWDYPFDNEAYKSYSFSEMMSQGYHIN